MAYAAPTVDQLFGGLPEGERVARFEAYKSALSAVHSKTLAAHSAGRLGFDGKTVTIREDNASIASLRSEISKAVSGDQLAAVEGALANIEKDLTLTSPLNNSTSGITGLVPYNLDPVLSLLVPKELYFRNKTARIKAIGQALEFRRITGVTNAGVGGVADQIGGAFSPNGAGFFSSASSATSFGGVSLNRPGKIAYAADKIVLPFREFGYSDSVSLQAEFAGMGYTDLRQLSHTALIWAHMLGEEKAMLKGRAAALSTSGLSFTASADSTAVAVGAAAGTATIKVTLSSTLGETAALSAGTVTLSAGKGASVTYTGTIPAGTVALNVYIVDSASANFKATTQLTTSGQLGLTFAASSAAPTNDYSWASDGSGNALGYDGFINNIITNGGYVKALNGALSTTEVTGDFQDAFVSLFNSVMGDPEAVVTTASIRRALAKQLSSQSSASSYRLNYELGQDGIAVGSLVGAIQNEATGRMVDLITHRFMPAGVAVILQNQLPFPDSGVSNCWEMHNVVDTMVIDWPQIGMSYDASTYSQSTLAGRAPAWSGVITNINA
jgi:hypothetical protein